MLHKKKSVNGLSVCFTMKEGANGKTLGSLARGVQNLCLYQYSQGDGRYEH